MGSHIMKKNIVICSDGTGNQSIKDRGTNVFKLYEAIDHHHQTTQLTFYDDGVGTEDLKFLKILGGAFGFGLSRNVRELYTNVARSYRPGDDIYLFGFSRGAYTVRTLAGFITHCGMLDIDLCANDADVARKVQGAYKAYRRNYKTFTSRIWRALFSWYTRWRYGFTRVEDYQRYTLEDGKTPVHFIGVWDTVSAVGFPIMGVSSFIDKLVYKFRFPSHRLHPLVRHARHAVSIDDKRKTFHPEMWDESDEADGRIRQVWFAGVHANVGGGYPKQGMSLVSLDWMLKEASVLGLYFNQDDARFFERHADVNDKLYNSRAGVSAYYRYAPRDIHNICRDYHIATALVHDSVYERTMNLTDGYAPGNLPHELKYVASGSDAFVLEDEALAFATTMGTRDSLLNDVAIWIALRKRLQLVFYVLTGLVVWLVIKEYSTGFIAELISDPQNLELWRQVIRVVISAGLLLPILLVYWLSKRTRERIQNHFSAFWYGLRHRHDGQ